MTSHQLARLLLSMPDAEVVHPGQAGDVVIDAAYRCDAFGVIVVADREDSEPRGSETGRHIRGPELPAHPDDADRYSLAEARRYVIERKAEGVQCPACKQISKDYRRKLNSSMARGLVWLSSNHGRSWADVPRSAPAWLLKTGGTFAKLKLWGLIEERVNEDTGKTHSGIWKTTELGEAFARGSARVPGYAVVYDGCVLRLEGEEVDIVQALGDHFDYAELWTRRGAA